VILRRIEAGTEGAERDRRAGMGERLIASPLRKRLRVVRDATRAAPKQQCKGNTDERLR